MTRFSPGDLLAEDCSAPASPRELIDVALCASVSHGAAWYDVLTAERGEIHRQLRAEHLRDSRVALEASP